MDFPSDFAKDVFLLLLTAVLVPIVLKQVDDRKKRDQQQFEATLARQGKVIDSQVALLENLAGLLWEFQLYAADVMFYHQPSTDRPDLYEKAVQEYEAKAGMLLARIRAEVSKLLRLAPRHVYEDFLNIYYRELLEVDTQLFLLIRHDERDPDDPPATGGVQRAPTWSWSSLQAHLVRELAVKVDTAIERLATELGLTWQASRIGSLNAQTEPIFETLAAESRDGPDADG